MLMERRRGGQLTIVSLYARLAQRRKNVLCGPVFNETFDSRIAGFTPAMADITFCIADLRPSETGAFLVSELTQSQPGVSNPVICVGADGYFVHFSALAVLEALYLPSTRFTQHLLSPLGLDILAHAVLDGSSCFVRLFPGEGSAAPGSTALLAIAYWTRISLDTAAIGAEIICGFRNGRVQLPHIPGRFRLSARGLYRDGHLVSDSLKLQDEYPVWPLEGVDEVRFRGRSTDAPALTLPEELPRDETRVRMVVKRPGVRVWQHPRA